MTSPSAFNRKAHVWVGSIGRCYLDGVRKQLARGPGVSLQNATSARRFVSAGTPIPTPSQASAAFFWNSLAFACLRAAPRAAVLRHQMTTCLEHSPCVAVALMRIRAQAADLHRLTAREDSGEPSEVTDLAAAARSGPRSACPAPELRIRSRVMATQIDAPAPHE
jgi:hypothetical protein